MTTRKRKKELARLYYAKPGDDNKPKKSRKPKKGTLFGEPRSEIVKRPGAFREKAKAAGMSTAAYAAKVTAKGSTASKRTKKQAALSKAFETMRKKKRRA